MPEAEGKGKGEKLSLERGKHDYHLNTGILVGIHCVALFVHMRKDFRERGLGCVCDKSSPGISLQRLTDIQISLPPLLFANL